MAKLSEAQLATLREMQTYDAYYFRRATCQTLVPLGLVIQLRPDLKKGPHKITPAGRAAIRGEG